MFIAKKYGNNEKFSPGCIFTNKQDNIQMSYISRRVINIAKHTTTNFVAITTRAEDFGVVVVDVAVAVGVVVVAVAEGVAVVVVER